MHHKLPLYRTYPEIVCNNVESFVLRCKQPTAECFRNILSKLLFMTGKNLLITVVILGNLQNQTLVRQLSREENKTNTYHQVRDKLVVFGNICFKIEENKSGFQVLLFFLFGDAERLHVTLVFIRQSVDVAVLAHVFTTLMEIVGVPIIRRHQSIAVPADKQFSADFFSFLLTTHSAF
jgi:hypothetical protein